MKLTKNWPLLAVLLTMSAFLVPSVHATGIDGGYVGTDGCLACHNGSSASDKTSFLKAGHPYKLKITNGATPAAGTIWSLLGSGSDSILSLASVTGTGLPPSIPSVQVDTNSSGSVDWSSISYIIGGYGWKARWGIKDTSGDDMTGYIWSSALFGASGAQFNILAADATLDPFNVRENWSSYGTPNTQIKKYDCAICHNTNGAVASANGYCGTVTGTFPSTLTEPWFSTGMTTASHGGFYSQWSLTGIQCEACHGKGSNNTNNGHADTAGSQNVLAITTSTSTGVTTSSIRADGNYAVDLAGKVEICAKCHIRGTNTTGASEWGCDPATLTNGAEVAGGYIRHHEQYNEMVGRNGDGAHAGLACTTCHDPHKRSHKVTGGVATALGITDNDQSAEARGAVTSCSNCHYGKTTGSSPAALAHNANNVTCMDCHMAEATVSATKAVTASWGKKGDVKTHIFKIDPSAAATDTGVGRGTSPNVATNALSLEYACGKCHAEPAGKDGTAGTTTVFANKAAASSAATGYHAAIASIDSGYVGSNVCGNCHTAKFDDFVQSGHPYKVRFTNGLKPVDNPNPGPGQVDDPLSALLVSTMPNTANLLNPNNETNVKVTDANGKLDWSAVSYLIGGYGWKARWGVKDTVDDTATGFIWSSSVASPTGAQFNLLAADPALDPAGKRADWSTYGNATKTYSCAICHNTNGTSSIDALCSTPLGSGRTEPWASTGLSSASPGGFRSEWTFSGVQCEECHGAGLNHAKAASAANITVNTSKDACGKCHIRSSNTSGFGTECGGDASPAILAGGAPISGGYIQHHEQYNEMVGVNSDGVHASLNCVTCHDPHKRSHKVTNAVAGALGITDNDRSAEARGAVVSCASCHPGKTLRYPMGGITCADCHMGEAGKSATNESPDGTWGRMGDVKTHIFKIDPTATTITRSNGFTSVATNALSVAFACGKCHDSSMSSSVGYPALTLAQAQATALNIHGDKPIARFAFAYDAATSHKVNFDAGNTTCPSGSCTYFWDFGDTTTGTGVRTSRTYANGATRNVILTVNDTTNGTSGTASNSVTPQAVNTPPVAAFAAPPAVNGYQVSFTDASTDAQTLPANLAITVNWGDGTTSSGTGGGLFPHTYASAGTFTITLTARDAGGLYNSTTASISVPTKYAISGTIFDSDGTTGLVGATVTLKQSGVTKATMTTVAGGAYTFANNNPGTYQVEVYKYGTTFDGDASGAPYTNPVNVTVGPNATGQNFTKVAPYTVTVNTSPALSGVTVYLKVGSSTKYAGTTGVAGNKVFTNVTPGTYQVQAVKTGYLFDGDAGTGGNQNPVNVTGPATVTFTHTP